MKSADQETIILCGGRPNNINLPIGINQSNAMIPINGKPVIGWILDDLLSKNIRRATVVLEDQNVRLKEFLHRLYSDRMEIRLAIVYGDGSIVRSLRAGLATSPPSGLVRLILGDTLIRDPFTSDRDFVYTAAVEDSRRWCLVETTANGQIVNFIDKQEILRSTGQALAGYYHFVNGAYLQHCVDQSISASESELSAVLRRYQDSYPIQAIVAEEWFDFGHIDNILDAKRNLLKPRYFNSLSINPVLNTITKISQNTKKLQDELDWYINLPDELKVLTPRILAKQQVNGEVQITQEYYGYPTLSELYVYGDIHHDTWSSILRHVLKIHKEFKGYRKQSDKTSARQIYLRKTQERVQELIQDDYWKSLLDFQTISYNGNEITNLQALFPKIIDKANEIADTAEMTIMHGDLCFSNILYDVNNQIIRLIDPRGSFGEKGIYGDPRYDIAKLSHSVCGLYDFIIADMFEVAENGNNFEGTIFGSYHKTVIRDKFENLVTSHGYNWTDIRFIEGLLFISMIPLHKDHPNRQKMMYLTGMSILNEVFK